MGSSLTIQGEGGNPNAQNKCPNLVTRLAPTDIQEKANCQLTADQNIYIFHVQALGQTNIAKVRSHALYSWFLSLLLLLLALRLRACILV